MHLLDCTSEKGEQHNKTFFLASTPPHCSARMLNKYTVRNWTAVAFGVALSSSSVWRHLNGDVVLKFWLVSFTSLRISPSVRPLRFAAKFSFYTDVAKIQETIQNLGNHAHWLRINICNLSECEESLLRTAFPWRKNDPKQSIKNRGKVANIKYEFANHLWRRPVGPPAMHSASKFEQVGLRSDVRIPKRQPSLGREPVRKQVWKKTRLLCKKLREIAHVYHPLLRVCSHICPIIPMLDSGNHLWSQHTF